MLRRIAENLLAIGIAILLIGLIRSSFVEAFKIPSGSMMPSLLTGDHIFVNKLSYGFRTPFVEFFGPPHFAFGHELPHRGDVIVFIYPKDPSIYFVKRVIGLPGDTVSLNAKSLSVNGQIISKEPVDPATEKQVLAEMRDPRFSSENIHVYRERFEGQEPHLLFEDRNSMSAANYGPVTVPPAHVFVLGDNRDFSNDSRFWGFVPQENIRGRAFMIFLSLWWDLPTRAVTFRPERIGHSIH